MCLKLCVAFCLMSLVLTVFILWIMLTETFTLLEIVHDRKLFLENQSVFYDAWSRRPLLQKHVFYLYNITNGDRFLQSETPMSVVEVGPFTYYNSIAPDWTDGSGRRVRSLSLDDLRFSPHESAMGELAFVHTLDITLIKNLSRWYHPFRKLPRECLVHKTTVRDALREIVDGKSLRTLFAESFTDTGKARGVRNVPKEHLSDADFTYLQSFRTEICTRLFGVVQFVNPPTGTSGYTRLFRKSPCDCLTVIPNGTDRMSRYTEVPTTKYLVRWGEDRCSRRPFHFYFPVRLGRYVARSLFWVSSPADWRDESCVQYHSKVEDVLETRIEVEPMSNAVTSFSLSYQFNIPMLFVGANSSLDKVHVYPVLMTATSGVARKDVESSLRRFIAFPRKRISQITSEMWFLVKNVSICLTSTLFIWSLNKVSRHVDAMARWPGLRRSLQIVIGIL